MCALALSVDGIGGIAVSIFVGSRIFVRALLWYIGWGGEIVGASILLLS